MAISRMATVGSTRILRTVGSLLVAIKIIDKIGRGGVLSRALQRRINARPLVVFERRDVLCAKPSIAAGPFPAGQSPILMRLGVFAVEIFGVFGVAPYQCCHVENLPRYVVSYNLLLIRKEREEIRIGPGAGDARGYLRGGAGGYLRAMPGGHRASERGAGTVWKSRVQIKNKIVLRADFQMLREDFQKNVLMVAPVTMG